MEHRLALVAALALAATLAGCPSKSKDQDPPPLPSETATPAPPPPGSASAGGAGPGPSPTPFPGLAPGTLAEAISLTRPQMADSVGAPDAGSAALGRYWAEKKYPWAQLEAVTATTPVALLTSTDAERGKRVCGEGMVQQFTPITAGPPHQYEGLIATKEGPLLSVGAVGDAAGIKQGAAAKFCGIASGVQTIATPDGKQSKALRLTGYFDTPANHGGGGAGQFASLRACCQALQQNSASMPPPQNMYAAAAAQYCLATVGSISSPQQKDMMLAGIRNALRGAPMPGGCR